MATIMFAVYPISFNEVKIKFDLSYEKFEQGFLSQAIARAATYLLQTPEKPLLYLNEGVSVYFSTPESGEFTVSRETILREIYELFRSSEVPPWEEVHGRYHGELTLPFREKRETELVLN